MDCEIVEIQERYKQYFQSRYLQHGNDVQTLWGSQASQEERFRILLEIADVSCKTVLDVGCGFGDLYGYVKKIAASTRQQLPEYTGMDIVDELIQEARKKYFEATFLSGDFISKQFEKKYNYVFASGIFFLENPCWEKYCLSVCKKMYDVASEGVAINFLSRFSRKKDSFSYYASPGKIVEMIMDNITKRCVLRHDYRENDFTIYLYKQI